MYGRLRTRRQELPGRECHFPWRRNRPEAPAGTRRSCFQLLATTPPTSCLLKCKFSFAAAAATVKLGLRRRWEGRRCRRCGREAPPLPRRCPTRTAADLRSGLSCKLGLFQFDPVNPTAATDGFSTKVLSYRKRRKRFFNFLFSIRSFHLKALKPPCVPAAADY